MWNESVAAAIRAADPLAFDGEPPAHQATTRQLISTLALFTDRAQLIPATHVASHAALRDLGMVAGAIRRAGTDPVAAVPDVEQTLIALGRRVDMVPRDTVLHYTAWNPTGVRQRSFTGSPAESVLVSAVRGATPALYSAIDLLAKARCTARHGGNPSPALTRAAAELATVVSAMRTVARGVPADYFAESLRPYFDEVVVGGRPYSGPAAAQLPIFVVDRLVWNSTGVAAPFQNEMAAYSPRRVRELYRGAAGQPALLELIDNPEPVRPVLRRLVELRGVHLAHARASYVKTRTDYRHGSAGGTVDLLNELLTAVRRTYRDI